MRIGIYDPYLDTLGGGEKYIFDLAQCLSDKNSVSIFWNDRYILSKAEERFGKTLRNVRVVKNVFSSNALIKYLVTKRYDAIFFMSDGSFPLLRAKKNFLILQFPVPWVKIDKKSEKKLKSINEIICYSDFVKESLSKTFNREAVVIPPKVEIRNLNLKKENIILSVGRFTKAMNRKKQEIMIQAFKDLLSGGLKDWKLVLAGSVLPQDQDFLNSLKESEIKNSIEIIPNASYDGVSKLYSKAKIYWHAAGFGEDLTSNPQLAEHFGISTVEAMGAGAVPVVFNGGGQKEIVQNGVSGFLWNSLEELKSITKKLIENQDVLNKISKQAENYAVTFSEERFCSSMQRLLND